MLVGPIRSTEFRCGPKSFQFGSVRLKWKIWAQIDFRLEIDFELGWNDWVEFKLGLNNFGWDKLDWIGN